MKKTIITLLAAGTCALGADLVAEWNDFSSLTSTVGEKSYTISTDSSYVSVTNGVLSVSNVSDYSEVPATATIDLSAAGLTMDNGITVSLTLSNLSLLGGGQANPAGIFGLATTNKPDFAFSAGYFTDKQKYSLAYNGSTSGVTTSELTAPLDEESNKILPTGDTPVIVTLTIKDTEVNYYINGDSIGASTIKTTDSDLTSDVITTLSFAGWVGSTRNGHCSAKYYDLAVYNGAMTAAEVKALTIPEPATATLSLLALAGLAARRRRK